MKISLLLLLILAFSFFIRIYQLRENPEGFDQTEAAFAYNAFSVLKSGHDEYGKMFPWVLVSIGDYKLAGYMYWQIPFIAVLGLSEFSARLSTLIAGMISLYLIYYLVRETLKNEKLALLTTFFTGIAPGHLILSRMAYDPMIAFMFYVLSLVFFLKWYRSKALWQLLVSSLAFCWSLGTYYAVWVILPFTVLFYWGYLFKMRKALNPSKLIIAFLILLLPLLTLGKFLAITGGERIGQDSTFQVHAQPLLEQQIREDQQSLPLLLTRALHNKLTFYPQLLLQNLSLNFSFDFLFLNGDKIDRRFWVPYHGILYLWSAPFLLLGVLSFWKDKALYKNLLVLSSIGIVFLGSAFSEFGSETERTLFAVPLLCLLLSYGLMVFFQMVTTFYKNFLQGFSFLRQSVFSRSVYLFTGVLLLFNITYFNHQYYYHANVHEPWGRDYAVKDMLATVASLKSNYSAVLIPDNSYIFYYFYNLVDPAISVRETKEIHGERNYLGLGMRKKVGDYLTLPFNCPISGRLNALYVCRGTKVPQNSKILKVISYRDAQPAFIFLEFTASNSAEGLPANISYFSEKRPLLSEADGYWKE